MFIKRNLTVMVSMGLKVTHVWWPRNVIGKTVKNQKHISEESRWVLINK